MAQSGSLAAMDWSSVVWIGGGCGAGKSTVARALAYRLDLRLYPVDAYTYAHLARANPVDQPWMSRVAEMDYTELHVKPDVDTRVEHFRRYAVEQFGLVLADLAASGNGPTIVVEGPSLFPELVAPLMPTPGHGLWLLPTPAFTRSSLTRRAEPAPMEESEELRRARERRYERDARLTSQIADAADDAGLLTIVVDGRLTVEASVDEVIRHFGTLLDRGCVDGAERSRVRRAENAVVNRQLEAFTATLPTEVAAGRTFDYVCECDRLGCEERVSLSLAAYGDNAGAMADGH